MATTHLHTYKAIIFASNPAKPVYNRMKASWRQAPYISATQACAAVHVQKLVVNLAVQTCKQANKTATSQFHYTGVKAVQTC